MMLSTELYLVAMLDEYIAPEPVVAGFVRTQLLRHESDMAIRQAVQQHQRGEHPTFAGEFYYTCLSYTGLDFNSENPALAAAVSKGLLHHHLFDLGLGRYFKASRIQRYAEFHTIRESISWLISKWADAGMLLVDVDSDCLWWDVHYRVTSRELPWVSVAVQKHPGFYAVFDSWLEASNQLQVQLAEYEKGTMAVNDPDSVDRFLPESVAIKALELAEVRVSA